MLRTKAQRDYARFQSIEGMRLSEANARKNTPQRLRERDEGADFKIIVDIDTHIREGPKATVMCVRHTRDKAEVKIVPEGCGLWGRSVEYARTRMSRDITITMQSRRETAEWTEWWASVSVEAQTSSEDDD